MESSTDGYSQKRPVCGQESASFQLMIDFQEKNNLPKKIVRHNFLLDKKVHIPITPSMDFLGSGNRW